MVRHDDEWWMNHKNTYGRLTCVKDMTASGSHIPNLQSMLGTDLHRL